MTGRKSKAEKAETRGQSKEQSPSKDEQAAKAKPWEPRVPNDVIHIRMI